jgi:hypothetical protein
MQYHLYMLLRRVSLEILEPFALIFEDVIKVCQLRHFLDEQIRCRTMRFSYLSLDPILKLPITLYVKATHVFRCAFEGLLRFSGFLRAGPARRTLDSFLQPWTHTPKN